MTRFSICLVGAALAAAACGDDTSSSSGGGNGGGDATTGTSTPSTSSTATGNPTTTGATGTQASSGQGGGATVTSTGQGGEGGQGVAPPFRTAVNLPDSDLALRALQIVGANVEGSEGHCLPCHALTEGSLTNWKNLTNGVLDDCLTDLEVSTPEVALQMIECVRDRTGVEGADKFGTSAVGFWAAGATRDWWRYTFAKAYPEDGEARYTQFVQQVKMPPGVSPALESDDYDLVGEWFVRGAPLLHELLDEPDPTGCDPLVTDDIADYVAERSENGWRSVNASNGMLMFGCEGDEAAIDCLSDEPEAPNGWHVTGQGSLKRLADLDYDSSYWTRGSADGRFVGHGRWQGGFGAAMVDLQDEHVIPVNALYDPGFFPDNSGFVFQGQSGNVCTMDVLTSDPDQINMNEDGCSGVSEVGLYQHVGASLGGGDYFAVDGPFESDDGGHQWTPNNPSSFWGPQSGATIIPMIFNGTAFQATDRIDVSTPNDGDAVISPSAGLLLSRSDGLTDTNSGYHLRRVDLTPSGGSFDVDTTEVGKYCISGGKPAFSYDERWIVIHHYVEDTDKDAIELGFAGRNDAGFSAYRNSGGSNIVLIDLVTGEQRRITNMPAGSYALFPFFRSDGWIYFLVRTGANGDGETVVASDAALLAEDD